MVATLTPEEWAARVVGRAVAVGIDEPSDTGERLGDMTGRIARVLYLNSPEDGRRYIRKRYLLALIKLDKPWEWERVVRVISIVSRSSFEDLNEVKEKVNFPVDVLAEPDWMLECSPDDPRIALRGTGLVEGRTNWLGYGGAQLL